MVEETKLKLLSDEFFHKLDRQMGKALKDDSLPWDTFSGEINNAQLQAYGALIEFFEPRRWSAHYNDFRNDDWILTISRVEPWLKSTGELKALLDEFSKLLGSKEQTYYTRQYLGFVIHQMAVLESEGLPTVPLFTW